MALDNIDELNVKNASPFPTALRYGLIGGLIGVALGIIWYLADMNMMLGMGIGLLSFIIYIIMIVLAIRAHRDKDLGGYISLGRCVGVGVIVITVTALMGLLWNVMLYQLIDPDIAEKMAEKTAEMMEGFDVPEDQIDEARENIKESSGLGKQIKNTLWVPVFGAVVSLIAGLIMKKSRPIEVE